MIERGKAPFKTELTLNDPSVWLTPFRWPALPGRTVGFLEVGDNCLLLPVCEEDEPGFTIGYFPCDQTALTIRAFVITASQTLKGQESNINAGDNDDPNTCRSMLEVFPDTEADVTSFRLADGTTEQNFKVRYQGGVPRLQDGARVLHLYQREPVAGTPTVAAGDQYRRNIPYGPAKKLASIMIVSEDG